MTRQNLIDACRLERTAVFLEPRETFDKGIIGVTPDLYHVIYDYDRLIQAFIEEGATEEEAIDNLEYNTLRSIPYMGEGKPEIIFSVDENP